MTIFVFICKTDQSKPVKPEVNGTVILPPLVFPATMLRVMGRNGEGVTVTLSRPNSQKIDCPEKNQWTNAQAYFVRWSLTKKKNGLRRHWQD